MKKRFVFLFLVSFSVIFKGKVHAQISIGGIPASWSKNDNTPFGVELLYVVVYSHLRWA